jgi:pilus assembly protein CpaB
MNPRQRRGLLLLVLSGLGLLAVFVLVATYVADVRTEVDPKITLLSLKKPLKAFESVPDDAVAEVTMPKRWAPKTALRNRAQLVGLVAGSDLPADSLLQKGMLIAPPELSPGQREVAILVDAETGVAGKIGPGSVVDIVGTFQGDPDRGIKPKSTVVVPAARIIDVGQAQLKGGRGVQQAEADPKEVVPVTFALSPKQQLEVTEAESFADEVRLALRRPGDLAPLTKSERTYSRPDSG